MHHRTALRLAACGNLSPSRPSLPHLDDRGGQAGGRRALAAGVHGAGQEGGHVPVWHEREAGEVGDVDMVSAQQVVDSPATAHQGTQLAQLPAVHPAGPKLDKGLQPAGRGGLLT